MQDEAAEVPQETKCTETILVVDDTASVRDLIRFSLQPLGYTIMEANSGETALHMINNNSTSIDMLLTDAIMPDMNGLTLASTIQTSIPGIKIVYMAGFSNEIIAWDETDEKIDFITKPIIPSQLELNIRKIFDA